MIQSAAIKYTPPGQGQPGIAYDMDPQGLAIIDHKYLIISAYSKSKTFDSVLWVLDFKTGRFVKPIALNNNVLIWLFGFIVKLVNSFCRAVCNSFSYSYTWFKWIFIIQIKLVLLILPTVS